MIGIPGLVSAPFSPDQVKSINRYQADTRTSHLTCEDCGGKYYAKEDGLVCGNCFSSTIYIAKFITNWSWNKFKYSDREEKNGVH